MKIELRNVAKSYGSRPNLVRVLDGVNLTIESNEFFFLLGASGSGKSTLLRLIAGFESADSGDILFNGRRVNDLPPEERRTPMVFQNYALWPHMTALENVAYGLSIQPISRAEVERRAMAALAATRIEELAARRPNELSGGQRQRVALSRAIALNAGVVLFDEPLSNLDAKMRLMMRGEIADLHRRHPFTAIYVTHDQEEAMTMGTRIAVLRSFLMNKDGNVAQVGAPEDVYARPADRFVAEFMGAMNWLEARVKETRADGIVILETPMGEVRAQRHGASPGTGAGARLLAGFRPASVALDSPSPEANRIAGEIVFSQYAGASQMLTVSAGPTSDFKSETPGTDEGKRNLRFQVLEHNPRRMRRTGERVGISFRPEDVILVSP